MYSCQDGMVTGSANNWIGHHGGGDFDARSAVVYPGLVGPARAHDPVDVDGAAPRPGRHPHSGGGLAAAPSSVGVASGKPVIGWGHRSAAGTGGDRRRARRVSGARRSCWSAATDTTAGSTRRPARLGLPERDRWSARPSGSRRTPVSARSPATAAPRHAAYRRRSIAQARGGVVGLVDFEFDGAAPDEWAERWRRAATAAGPVRRTPTRSTT